MSARLARVYFMSRGTCRCATRSAVERAGPARLRRGRRFGRASIPVKCSARATGSLFFACGTRSSRLRGGTARSPRTFERPYDRTHRVRGARLASLPTRRTRPHKRRVSVAKLRSGGIRSRRRRCSTRWVARSHAVSWQRFVRPGRSCTRASACCARSGSSPCRRASAAGRCRRC